MTGTKEPRDAVSFPRGALKFGPGEETRPGILHKAWLEMSYGGKQPIAWLRSDGYVWFVPIHESVLPGSSPVPKGWPMLFARAVVNEFEKVWSRHEQAKLPNWIVGGKRFHTREEAWLAAWTWFTRILDADGIADVPPMPDDINQANLLLRGHTRPHILIPDPRQPMAQPIPWLKIEKFGDDPLLCTLSDYETQARTVQTGKLVFMKAGAPVSNIAHGEEIVFDEECLGPELEAR